MKFSRSVVALAVASFANAQLDLPQCALSCLMDAAKSTPCDELLDFKCQCSQTQLVEQVTPCVKSSCSIDDQKSASSTLVALCSKNGVPITVPPVEGGSGSSGTSEPARYPTQHPINSPTGLTSEPEPDPSCSPYYFPVPSSSAPKPTGTGGAPMPPIFSSSPPFDGAGTSIHASIVGVAAALLGLAAYL